MAQTQMTKALNNFVTSFNNSGQLMNLLERGGQLALDELNNQADILSQKVTNLSFPDFNKLSREEKIRVSIGASTEDTKKMTHILGKINNFNAAIIETLPNVLLAFLIEIFEAYLEEIAVLISQVRPDLIGLSTTGTNEEVIRIEVKHKLDGVFYDKLDSKLFVKNLSISFDDAAIKANTSSKELDKAKNVRNIYIHNNGNISQRFLNRANDSSYILGQKFPLTQDYLNDLAKKFYDTIENFDQEAANKYPQILAIN